jgi:uncharacterized protein YuzE
VTPTVRWHPLVRALYARIRSGPVKVTREVPATVLVDFDAKGRIVGVEVLLPKVPPKR